MYMNVYMSGQSKCNMSADAHGGKKRESDPPEPERQVTGSHWTQVVGHELRSSEK